MIKAVIIEDNPGHSESLIDLIKGQNENIQILSVARNVEEGIKAIYTHLPELVFLDIELENGETGFDLLNELGEIDFEIIFTTAHNDSNNLLNAIRLCALDYLIKPIIPEELKGAINTFLARRNNDNHLEQIRSLISNMGSRNFDDIQVWIHEKNNIYPVFVKDILVLESENTYTHFNLINKQKITTTQSIKDWEKILTPLNFCRVHNKHLVNVKHIINYERGDGGCVKLTNGNIVPVSKSRKPSLMALIDRKY